MNNTQFQLNKSFWYSELDIPQPEHPDKKHIKKARRPRHPQPSIQFTEPLKNPKIDTSLNDKKDQSRELYHQLIGFSFKSLDEIPSSLWDELSIDDKKDLKTHLKNHWYRSK